MAIPRGKRRNPVGAVCALGALPARPRLEPERLTVMLAGHGAVRHGLCAGSVLHDPKVFAHVNRT